MSTIPGGVYMITNQRTGTAVDLSGGEPVNGTMVQGWQRIASQNRWLWDQYWLVQPVPGDITYTLCNISSGTVLELSNGGSVNGTQAQCWTRARNPFDPAAHNQEWRFDFLGDNTYRLVNKRSGTALELLGGGDTNGTQIVGSLIIPENPNQHWVFRRVSTPEGAEGSVQTLRNHCYLLMPHFLYVKQSELLG
ncbi:ricin B lectin domain-containing protein [Mycena leptocephala]|nr:ricin B lectin domain-containing protein [Mycena leptocephala]